MYSEPPATGKVPVSTLHPAPPAFADINVGAVFGDYDLFERIGVGGMGVVFRARQRRLSREVALKFLPAPLMATAESLHRFRVEAESMAAIDHPNIVPIHDAGVSADGRPYYTMKLVKGRTL